MTLCATPGCDLKSQARSLCGKHYQRWRRHRDPLGGDPERKRLPSVDTYDRFWSKVDVGHPLGCWVWTDALDPDGYGRFFVDGANLRAHRVSYGFFYGEPAALDETGRPLGIDHLCRNRACVNPDHLEVVTRAENARRGWSPAMRVVVSGVCLRGHVYSHANTYIAPSGKRFCRACTALRQRAYQQRKAAGESIRL